MNGTVIRWNPIREIAALHNAMDRAFENDWRAPRSAVADGKLPVDAYETDSAYVIYATLPGVNPDAINVSLDDDLLSISGEVAKPAFDDKDNARARLVERAYGKFSRSLRLALPVDADKIEAAYENGVLKLTLPKQPEVQPKTIPVRFNGRHN